MLLSLSLTRHQFRGKGALNFLVLAPFLVPHIVLAVGIMLVLAPIALLDTYAGIVLAHLGITIPYTVRTIMASLMAVDRRVEEAALVHGAPPLQVFWRITLPLVRPGLISGAVIAFLISFDEATISLFIVSVRSSTLPTESGGADSTSTPSAPTPSPEAPSATASAGASPAGVSSEVPPFSELSSGPVSGPPCEYSDKLSVGKHDTPTSANKPIPCCSSPCCTSPFCGSSPW